jgi:signal transduction histidine kinase
MTRVLVVDDVRENRYLMLSLLKGHGFEASEAANGSEALSLALAAPPDLIISDILMPGMDGFELCRRCKQDPVLQRVPFLVYTATYTDPKDERLALGLGADRFVLKPQTPEHLMEVIREVLDEAGRGQQAASGAPPEMTAELLRQHNEALIRKLEEKVQTLEAEAARRQAAEEERRRLEAQLQKAQRLEAIGRLAGGIAHDFNNLLSVLLLYTDSALDALQGHPEVQGDLKEIRRAAERAVDLVQQLLIFSQRQGNHPRLLHLNEVVLGIEGMSRRILGKNVAVELRLAGDLGQVMADPGQVEQVLLNLVVNARDAMPQGGKLTIETSSVVLDEEGARRSAEAAPGRFAVLSVADTGVGMDPDTLARLFEPFFTTKERGKGTGLGLANVHGIARQSGGFVEVESAPGQGATFRVYLPRVDGEGGA